MPKKIDVRTQAKLTGGGPKDGEVLVPPGGKPPETLQFRAKLVLVGAGKGMVHFYQRKSCYMVAGYEVHVYEYGGVRALE